MVKLLREVFGRQISENRVKIEFNFVLNVVPSYYVLTLLTHKEKVEKIKCFNKTKKS